MTIDDFRSLGIWLERAEREFAMLNEDSENHTHQQAIHQSLFATLIARVIKMRSDYVAIHNHHNT